MAGLLALAGCGFTPLYGQADGPDGPAPLTRRLAEVEVANIPERVGQMLRLSLQDQLYQGTSPTVQRYLLTVSYAIAQQGIGVQPDSSTTRNRFIATARWTLAPVGSPLAPLATGAATTENAENVIDQQYFALTLETTTVDQQLADTIAGQIATEVAAWFRTHPGA